MPRRRMTSSRVPAVAPAREPSRPRRRRRRSSRRSNPTFEQILAGILVVGSIGAVTILVVQHYRRRGALAGGLQGGVLPPQPLVFPTPPASGQVGDLCGDATGRYPGFVWDGTLCVPGPTTPPGLYLRADCGDFWLVDGEGGPQADQLVALLDQTANASRWNDPTSIAAAYLSAFWPECSWPPAQGASPRVVQLYMALSFALGREILIAARETTIRRRRGRVLGQSDPTAADEAVATRLAELGLPSFDPSVVPEIELPEVPGFVSTYVPPPPPPLPEPQPGTIQLPKPPTPVELLPTCMVKPGTREGHWILKSTNWTIHKQKIFDAAQIEPEADCHVFDLIVGICMRTRPGASYGLLDYAVADWPIKGVDQNFQPIQSVPSDWIPGGGEAWSKDDLLKRFQIYGWDPSTDLQKFKLPGTYKMAYRMKVIFTPEGTMIQDVHSINPQWDRIDACSENPPRWIDKDLQVGGADPSGPITRPWNLPTVDFSSSGKRIQARVVYRGLPVFISLGGQGVAVFEPENSYDLYYKSWWIGLGNP